ncbi:hypothetical protein [Streptomyces sp. H34-S4]|uniref:hypothetical protein n=1 Tax=Streptomyces sp. H34-S4 TaxID=2996463 RepID=UPI0022713858|nr:hypothetical protein [Streptomyces sp. H34-S4]MCY0939360.1 hypothetical protein [Streptomyces sp. H34-S4]
MSAGRSRVWLSVGQIRIRADKITTITHGYGHLLHRVTGHCEDLALELPDTDYESGTDISEDSWADELLRIIERAAAESVGTLITLEPATDFHTAGFTARSLTDNQPVIQPPLRPVPDVIPHRPVPAAWVTPRPRPEHPGCAGPG